MKLQEGSCNTPSNCLARPLVKVDVCAQASPNLKLEVLQTIFALPGYTALLPGCLRLEMPFASAMVTGNLEPLCQKINHI